MSSEVADALSAWEKAPASFRVMGGSIVGSLLAALVALEKRIEQLEGEKHGA